MGNMMIGSNPGLWGASLGQYAPKACSNLSAKASNQAVLLTWKDPEDYTTTDGYAVEWMCTRILRKTGGYPVDENDGTIVVTSSTRNQYASTAYTDSGLTNHTKYYYRAFSCSTDGVYNHEQVQINVTPIPYKTMTVKLNLANSNPSSIGSYADDATSMTAGKNVDAWEEFFGYKPCLFKNGKVVGYLKRNDYTKFENGTAADITSGNAGDVMIEFPRRGVKISKSGKVVTVSMTDNPNDSSFKYYAHQRGSTNKDYFYLGAYVGYVANGKLRSISGKYPTVSTTLEQFDTYGKANGTGYGCMGYYQWLFIQVMYILQYKGNLDSQNVHGWGLCAGDTRASGSGNTKGVMFGSSNTGQPIKLFGLEDTWGNVYQFVNNYYSNSNYHVTTTTDDTITDTSKYTDRGSYGGSSYTSGYPTDCMGTTEAGFTGTYGNYNGSSSTYFCDYADFGANHVPIVGGYYGAGTYDGVFCFYCNYSRGSGSGSYTGSRLGYL